MQMEEIKKMIADGNLVVAVALLTQQLVKNPDDADALELRGRLLMQMGDRKGAEADAGRLMQIDPQRMERISGDFTAKGVEEVPQRKRSFINPLGI